MRGLSIFSISSLASLLRRLPFLVQICVYDCCVAYVRIRVCVYVFVLYEELADCTAASATMFGAGLCVCVNTPILLCISIWGHVYPIYIHPFTEEIRLEIFGFPDLSIFLIDHFSDGDSVYSSEEFVEFLGNLVKSCLICTGTPVKICCKFWQS